MGRAKAIDMMTLGEKLYSLLNTSREALDYKRNISNEPKTRSLPDWDLLR